VINGVFMRITPGSVIGFCRDQGTVGIAVRAAVYVRRTLASLGPQRVMLCRAGIGCPMTAGGLLWNGGQFQ
jgi:hypothetical protein